MGADPSTALRDDPLLERLRRELAGNADVAEKPMVGGRSFSIRGRMFCGVTRAGLMVRVGRDGMAAALAEPHVSRMALGGRALAAFVIVAPPGVATDGLLAAWIQRGATVVTGEARPAASKPVAPARPPPGAAPAPSAIRFAELVEHFARHRGITLPEPSTGRNFGASALKVHGSIFAMLTRDHLVVKLPAARVTELIDAGTGEPFTAGKTAPMKQWLTVTTNEPSTWLSLAREAHAFVGMR